MGEEAPPLQWRPELYNLPLPDPEDLPPPPPPSSSSSSSSSSESDSEVEPEPEPFLIKAFFKRQRHHSQAEYAQALNGKVPIHQALIHTWTLDVNLRDISNTIRDQGLPEEIRSQSNIMFSFALVQLAEPPTGQYTIRRVARTMCNAERIIDDNMMLPETGFRNGDFLDVAVRFPGGRKKHFLDLFSS